MTRLAESERSWAASDHGVGWLARAEGTRLPVRPTSLARLRCRASEKKWPEARPWCERRHLNKGYVLRKKGKPDPTPPGRKSGRPPDTTSSSLGMPSRACTSRAQATDRMTNAGGATRRILVVLSKRTTYSSTVPGGKTNRPSCGRGSKRQPRGRSGSGVSATPWGTRGAARRCSTSCGVRTLDERLPRWRRAGIARVRRRKWWRRARWRRRGPPAFGNTPPSSDPRAGVFSLCFPWCLTCCVVVRVLLGCCAGLCFVSFCSVCFYCLAEGWGEGAATEPALRGETAGRKTVFLTVPSVPPSLGRKRGSS